MPSPIDMCRNGTEVASLLDAMAKKRKLRVYVMNYKQRSREKTTELIRSADVVVDRPAWELLDDPSRYEWVNK
jgi:hypothetical protein